MSIESLIYTLESSEPSVVEVLLDALEPFYEDRRRQKENNKILKEHGRAAYEKQKAAIKAIQDSCTHVAGCKSSSLVGAQYLNPGNMTSIVWHTGNIVFGICQNCGRLFNPEDSDYEYWRSRASFNLPSAGSATFILPTTVEEHIEGIKDQFCVLDGDIVNSGVYKKQECNRDEAIENIRELELWQ